MRDQAASNRGPYGMELIFKGGRYTEVSTSAANGPEKIGLFILARPQHLALGADELDRAKIVESKTMLAH